MVKVKISSPLYKNTGIVRDRARKSLQECTRLQWSEQTFREMMMDFRIPPDMADEIVKLYTAARETIVMTGGTTVYQWSNELQQKVCSVDNGSVRAVIEILCSVMPQPSVDDLRNHLVHACTEPLYTEEMSSMLEFAVYWVKPYTERKVRSFENERTGRVNGIELYRTTDAGQQGRIFSESDITDLVNRTILISFCPLICRAVPVTDKGNGIIVLKSCTARMEIGEHVLTGTGNRSTLSGKEETLKRRYKKYKCTEEQWAAASPKEKRLLITERMYNEGMSKVPSVEKVERRRKRIKNYTERKKNYAGWFIVYTCSETGQEFSTFTQSLQRAERLSSYTSIVAVMEDSLVDSLTVGLFGTVEHPVMLINNSVTKYTPSGVYFRTLKYMMYTIYEYLFRRSVEITDQNLAEHRYSKMARKFVHDTDFSLYEASEHLLTNEQKDVVEVELTLTEFLPHHEDHRERRVSLYRRLVYDRTGKWPNVGRYQYEKLKAKVYTEILEIMNSDQKVEIGPPEEMSTGFNPLLLPAKQPDPIQIPLGARMFNAPVFSTKVVVFTYEEPRTEEPRSRGTEARRESNPGLRP